MKKIALFACVCCAMIFSSCNRSQQTYTTTTEFFMLNPTNTVSVKAVLGTINSYWTGDYTFTGNDVDYTDLKAETKYVTAITAIMLHDDEIEEYMDATDYFLYNLYRKSDMTLLESTKFYVDAEGDLAYEKVVDNVDDAK